MTSHTTLKERFEEMIGPNDLILKNKEFGTIIDTSGNLNKTVLAFIESELSSSATKIREEERTKRNVEIADLLESIVFNHTTPELEAKVPFKHLRNIISALRLN